MLGQVRFADAQAVEAVAVRIFIDQQVGHDALGLDRAAFRRVVAGRRQFDGRVGRQLADGLHGTLAEGWRADDGGALVILQGTGDDFRGRGRTRVDQHHQRHFFDGGRQFRQRIAFRAEGIVFGAAIKYLFRVRQLAVGRDDGRVLRQEGGRDADGALQHAARIVAQVQHHALDVWILLVQGRDLRGHVVDGRFLELRHAQPGVARLDHLRLHALLMDFLARDGEGQRLRFILAGNGQRHLGARFAAHALDAVVQADAFHGLAIEACDQVSGLDAGAVGG